MDDMFTPTLDWGNELLDIAVWIAKAWAIAAVCHPGDPGADRPVHQLG